MARFEEDLGSRKSLSPLEWGYAVILITVLLAAEVSGEILIELYVRNNYTWRIVAGISIYLLVPFLFWGLLHVLGGNALTVANTVWQALNVATVALISYFVLKESINWLQWVGVSLAIGAVVLVALPDALGWKGDRYKK